MDVFFLWVIVLFAQKPMLSASNDMSMEKALAASLANADTGSHSAVKLLYNVFVELTKYECQRYQSNGNQDVCSAWTAVNLIEALELQKINCDDEPKNKICKKARLLLGGNLEHDQVVEGLFALGKNVPSQDFPALNAIRDGVIKYVCQKEPGECKKLRLELGFKFN